MVLGTLLIGGALSLFLSNQKEETAAEEAAQSALVHVMEVIDETGNAEDDEDVSQELQGLTSLYSDPYDTEMTVKQIDGYGYIGYLTIPALGLELPVMDDWDYSRLKIAPCRFYGSTKTDDLVIAGHNYRRHFSPLKQLKVGAEVYFTDMDGLVTAYQVAEIDVLNPSEVEEMNSGEFELSLFTCTYGGQNRLTLRCAKVE